MVWPQRASLPQVNGTDERKTEAQHGDGVEVCSSRTEIRPVLVRMETEAGGALKP